MRITFGWIRDYVDFEGAPEDMARRLTLAGFDVEEVVAAGDEARLDVDVPSNRPDCLGVLGLARELAALSDRPLRAPAAEPKGGGPDVGGLVQVRVEVPEACPRYTARLIRGVRVAPSPDWLRARLQAVGLAPVNNVVDVTNYVLLECGQPLHAFDASRLRGGRVVVRRGRPGEKLVALNGREYAAGPEVLVIADAEGPVAFAGVMGGKGTEIVESTRDVLLESAQFDPVTVRRGARRLGLASESSYRFERGVAHDGVEWASRRAAALIEEVAGGETCSGVVDVATQRPGPRRIALRLARCGRVLGMACERKAVLRVLEAIGCRIEEAAGDRIDVVAPDHRRDLACEADLIEEVARLGGYDQIPTTPQLPMVLTERDPHGEVEARVRQLLVGLGYQEALTPSFAEGGTAADFRLDGSSKPVIVLGKGGAPDRPLRMAVAASLLGVLRTNARYGAPLPRVFEIASVYGQAPASGSGAPGGPGGEPWERTGLGLAIREDFRTLRGHLEALAEALRIPVRFASGGELPAPWPAGRTAVLEAGGVQVGAAAEMDAADARRWDLSHDVCVAEIDLSAWIARASLDRRYRDFPRLPEVVRDLAVVVDDAVSWERVADAVRAAAPPWMERLAAFDVFRGAQIPPGRKSLAFSMTFRRPERTLTREEVDSAVGDIVRRLEGDLGARLRG